MYQVVFVTVPSRETAMEIGKAILNEKLCACANIIPGVTSLYWWQDKIQEDSEMLMIIKTREDLFESLKNKIVELHPYEVPEVVAMPIINGNEPYLKWIKNVTVQKSEVGG
jgi:periplasmic divalent cation tolerance protein